jgi:hypothetical protein
MRIDQPRRCKAWHNRSSPENGWASRPRFTFLRSVSGLILRRVKLSDGITSIFIFSTK